jgi:hypothetical protein
MGPITGTSQVDVATGMAMMLRMAGAVCEGDGAGEWAAVVEAGT